MKVKARIFYLIILFSYTIIITIYTCSCDKSTMRNTPPTVYQEDEVTLTPPQTEQFPTTLPTKQPTVSPTALEPELLSTEDDYYSSYDYHLLVEETRQRELAFIFGEDILYGKPQTIIDAFGEPIDKQPPESEPWQDADYIGTWLFSQGFSICVGTESDSQMIENYICLSSICDLKLSSGVCIGSTREEVYASYGKIINPMYTNDLRIAIDTGICFSMCNDAVQSVYIGTGNYDFEFWERFWD